MTDLAQIRDKILALETVLLRQDPLAIPQVHESTVAAMSLIGDPAGNVCKVHIYTDGSFKEAEDAAAQQAGWAFVVILEHSCTEYSFHGFAAGELVVGSEHVRPPAWVGTIKAGCDTAELAAITWACRWCIYHMCVEARLCGLPVILHVDSHYAISSVNGHARPAVNGEAVHFARAAKCVLETFSQVTVEWIAGHIGHPWNELADAAAKQAAHNHVVSATRLFGSVDPFLSHRQLDWFFLSRLAKNDRMQYPTIVDGAFSVTNHVEMLCSSDVATLLEGSVENVNFGSGSCAEMVSLRVATANVNSLSPSDESVDGPTLAVTGRILALQSQFAQCGLQMVGIQEGRMRTSALRMCPDYFCLVTPANASGCFGCELWVSTAIPWNGRCGGTKRFFKPNDFQVMFADERMLGVAARWEGYALDVVVAHAPCNVRHSAGDPGSENRAWWKRLAREIRKAHNPEAGLVWMIDANGKVGWHECNAVGCLAAEKENDNGLMLREALMELEMFLPATFGDCAGGESEQWTWTSTVGTTHRLDYIALSEKFRNNDVKAYVETSVDLATVRPDHRLVVCDFTVSQGQGGKWFNRRQCGYDRKAVQSVEACTKFRAMLQHAPCVDWSVDIDSHLALQNAYILYAARQCFVSQCKPRKKAWISERSLELVRQKRVAVRVWTNLRRKWRWSMLKRVFDVWKTLQNGKIPIFILQMHQARMCVMRSIIANERKMARLGAELKKSLADDKIKHIRSIVNAAFVERASGDDRAFWKAFGLCEIVVRVVLG